MKVSKKVVVSESLYVLLDGEVDEITLPIEFTPSDYNDGDIKISKVSVLY